MNKQQKQNIENLKAITYKGDAILLHSGTCVDQYAIIDEISGVEFIVYVWKQDNHAHRIIPVGSYNTNPQDIQKIINAIEKI